MVGSGGMVICNERSECDDGGRGNADGWASRPWLIGEERVQAGRLFNLEAEKHGRDARATTGGPPYMFLRNEPNLFSPKNRIYPLLLQCVTHEKIS